MILFSTKPWFVNLPFCVFKTTNPSLPTFNKLVDLARVTLGHLAFTFYSVNEISKWNVHLFTFCGTLRLQKSLTLSKYINWCCSMIINKRLSSPPEAYCYIESSGNTLESWNQLETNLFHSVTLDSWSLLPMKCFFKNHPVFVFSAFFF